MKDLSHAQHILSKFWLSQHNYIKNMLDRFNMRNLKPISTLLASHFKLISEQCPTSEKTNNV